ncbi:MAG: bifunctional sugar-1-phosphate nucleotidylyltransferase/acetyltransferase [Thermoplasmatota archaeon]
MKCVMLAAGEGKRMHPLTSTRPKVMLPIANKPLLEWNLIHARDAGVKEFLFILSYKAEIVRSYFKDGSDWDVSIRYINQGKPLGTGHAVGVSESFVDDVLVFCGDTVFGTNDIIELMKHENSMGLFTVENPQQYGVVETKDDSVVRIHEKMQNPLSHVINTGGYHFSHDIFKYIEQLKPSVRREYELTDAINEMAMHHTVRAVNMDSWFDVCYPWDLLDAQRQLLSSIMPHQDSTVEEHVNIKGPVCIGASTIVRSGSYIEGPVCIGNHCSIGPNCHIRPYTSIGNGCHVGNACEIKNSIIMSTSKIPHHNYVGDSIIGEGCNLGSGTKIANLRLDKQPISVVHRGMRISTGRRKLGVIMGDNVETGINAMINTGSIIGDSVFIGPGAIVSGEVLSGSRYY